jgi:hypothetical protein
MLFTGQSCCYVTHLAARVLPGTSRLPRVLQICSWASGGGTPLPLRATLTPLISAAAGANTAAMAHGHRDEDNSNLYFFAEVPAKQLWHLQIDELLNSLFWDAACCQVACCKLQAAAAAPVRLGPAGC